MKKRYISFMLVIVILIGIFIYSTNKPNNYSLDYELEEYGITESYDKDSGLYSFKLTKDEYVFYYVINHKYTSKRKLVQKLLIETLDNDYICADIKVFDNTQGYICSNTKEYKDAYQVGLLEIEDKEVVKKYEDINIYQNGSYYEWNGYGFTEIMSGKKINVLSKEKYDNSLAYQFKNYIIFADYDNKNEFKKFYVLDMKTSKISTIESDNRISFDSYFEGSIGNYVYLFDRNNSIQYAINVEKKFVKVTSDNEGAVYYDNERIIKPLKDFKYKNLVFESDNIINYTLKDNKLYMNYINSDIFINIFNDVSYIAYKDENKVLFLSKDKLYEYEYGKGYKKIASSLEWEFHYDSQIYIMN